VFYLLRSSCAWRMLAREFPPWQTVYYHIRKWRLDGRLRQAHDRLREEVRQAEGRLRDPSGAVIDRAKRSRAAGLEDRSADMTGLSASPVGSVTYWYTLVGSC
jgi:putative transposase